MDAVSALLKTPAGREVGARIGEHAGLETFTATSAVVGQLPGPFNSVAGAVFIALVAFLAVVLVARVVLRVAWRLALIAAVGAGVVLLVTSVL